MKYTNSQLTRAILRDLVTDIRCAERDGLPSYAAKCREQFATLWPIRHGAKLDTYGWPDALKAA